MSLARHEVLTDTSAKMGPNRAGQETLARLLRLLSTGWHHLRLPRAVCDVEPNALKRLRDSANIPGGTH